LLKTALTHLFKGFAWNSQEISSSQVPALMNEILICKDCCYQIEELVAIVDSCDKDVNEAFDMDGLVALISKVTERSRAMQRDNEAVVAKQLGFTFGQVFRMRRSFASLTSTGAIGVPELRLWFQEINPHFEPSTKEIEALIEEFSPLVTRAPSIAVVKDGQSASENASESGQKRRNSHEIPGDLEVDRSSHGGSQYSDSSEDVDVETALEAISSATMVHSRKSLHHGGEEHSDDDSGHAAPTRRRSSLGSLNPDSLNVDGDHEGTHVVTEDGQEEQANQLEDKSTGLGRQSMYCNSSGNVMYFEGYMRLMHRLLKT